MSLVMGTILRCLPDGQDSLTSTPIMCTELRNRICTFTSTLDSLHLHFNMHLHLQSHAPAHQHLHLLQHAVSGNCSSSCG